MHDMSDPLDMMRSRADNVRRKYKRMRQDARLLTATADELETLEADLRGDIADVEKWSGSKVDE